VIAIIGVLLAMLLPAAFKVRATANLIRCEANMRQIGMGFQNCNTTHHRLPPLMGAFPSGTLGQVTNASFQHGPPYGNPFFFLLPFVDQDNAWQACYTGTGDTWYQTSQGYEPYGFLSGATPGYDAIHSGQRLYVCPAQPGVPASGILNSASGLQLGTFMNPANVPQQGVGLCSYAVNAQVFGLDPTSGNVILQGRASIPSSIADGASNTILVAERYGICGFYMNNPTQYTWGNPPMTSALPGGQAWAWWAGWNNPNAGLSTWPPLVDSAVPAFAVPNTSAFPLYQAAATTPYWLGPPYNAAGPTDSTGNAISFVLQPVPYDTSSTTTKCDVFLPSSAHQGVMVVALADGSARTLAKGMSNTTFWFAVTPNDHVVLPADWNE
jgi:hypothetical protein